eukprot:TRINITY_DN10753_c0_g1_i1.p1 TRINITY_DN10753_c0_g1~~TRINITY_DN10753_c0_g1_i1.p1  ORF type:complete len:317 (-),score=29.93 TRINITY_DN10753_c0_g1_i1:28-978(-)
MGISICEDDGTPVSLSYDVQSKSQGIIYLGYAVVCTGFEALFILMTVRLCCYEKKVLASPYGMVFFSFFHLSMISAILYFLGGVVCYGTFLYNAIANFSYLFQGLGVLAVSMEIADSLEEMRATYGSTVSFKAVWLIPPTLLYMLLFIFIFLNETNADELKYFFLYNGACHIIIACAFYSISLTFNNEIVQKYPSFVSTTKRNAWTGVSTEIIILLITREIIAILNHEGFTFYLKVNHQALFTIYIISLSVLFDLLPCGALGIFMQMQLDNKSQSKNLEEVFLHLEEKKSTCFTKPENDNIMGEMMGEENIDEMSG